MTEFNFEIAMSVCKSSEQFPVHFDRAWEWLEFSRKDSAKRHFESCDFVEGVDFIVIHQKVEDGSKFGGWKTIEKIQMTVDCFKSWSMMVGTAKGKEVRKYFLECEKALKERNDFQEYLADMLRSAVQDILAPEIEEIRKFREACKDHKGAGQVIEANVEEKEYPIELLTCHEYCALHGVDKRLWNTFSRRYGRFTFAGKGLTPPMKKGRLAITGIFYEYADVILKNVMKCG